MSDWVKPTTGPIMACDDAIAHYKETCNTARADIKKLEGQLTEKKQHLHMYQDMLEQWQQAKTTLVEKSA